ncbi:hypothetical protein BSL82_14890 [Tardibacter chloracetimidivorans]|uniref:Lipoprotein n=1 Tax=Tardibacter chloracetimidivorans TaxID=1921510 RepID=A0A1L3ZXT6_9SPHN|nr:hypothetical protein [Tardibacter chloracetimidivorans]API60409.1 hypothetical protein BSL82_14890 [Tardibacter chloracetimidivorans]
MKPAALVVPLAVALAACTSAAEESAGPGAGQANSRVVDATPVGEPQNCVNLANIRESRVLSNQVIDFYLRDGRVMRNTLPHSCPQLGFERAFSYETSLSQLCNVDIITVIVQAGGPTRGASCGLGLFQPVKLAKK